jgi:hypothetical protein
MTIQQSIVRDLATLDETELNQVAQYLSFLKFRGRAKRQPEAAPQSWEALYREAADEDRELAEAGLSDYANGLTSEDAR